MTDDLSSAIRALVSEETTSVTGLLSVTIIDQYGMTFIIVSTICMYIILRGRS